MLGWLAARLVSGAGPYLLGAAGVVVLGLTATIGWQAWQLQQSKADLAAAQAQYADARAAIAACEQGAAELQHRIGEQNQRIESIKRERDRASALAAVESVRMLTATRERDLPEGHGPQVMNRWLRDAVAP